MDIAYVVVTVVTIAAATAAAVADYVRAEFVLANAAELGLPPSWLMMLGHLKLAGAVGLTVGLVGVRAIGIAAAVGLVLFFIGAIVVHLRARVFTMAPPGFFLALSVASLVLVLNN